jgi:hypothetical protein
MRQFTIIYIYPDDDRIGSTTIFASDADEACYKAARYLSLQDMEEVDIICAIPGAAAHKKWQGPAADGWKICNVADYLKSMEEN